MVCFVQYANFKFDVVAQFPPEINGDRLQYYVVKGKEYKKVFRNMKNSPLKLYVYNLPINRDVKAIELVELFD